MERTTETANQHEHSGQSREHESASFSAASPLSPALRLQQQAGNQAVQQLLRSGVIQAKLAISNPDDPEEREADKVAHTIMNSHSSVPASTACSCSHDDTLCEVCQQKQFQPTIQRRASAPSAPAHVPQIVSEVLLSPGLPLDSPTRAFFEPRFGHDFSEVRVHTGAGAAESARAMNALAYAVGNNLVFDQSQYRPSTPEGKQLLAHELTHAVQQRRSASIVLQRAPTPQPGNGTPDADKEEKRAAHVRSIVGDFVRSDLLLSIKSDSTSATEKYRDSTLKIETIYILVDQKPDAKEATKPWSLIVDREITFELHGRIRGNLHTRGYARLNGPIDAQSPKSLINASAYKFSDFSQESVLFDAPLYESVPLKVKLDSKAKTLAAYLSHHVLLSFSSSTKQRVRALEKLIPGLATVPAVTSPTVRKTGPKKIESEEEVETQKGPDDLDVDVAGSETTAATVEGDTQQPDRPRSKGFWDDLLDFLTGFLKGFFKSLATFVWGLAKGVLLGIKELGLMAWDLLRFDAATILGLLGYEYRPIPHSGLAKALASGMTFRQFLSGLGSSIVHAAKECFETGDCTEVGEIASVLIAPEEVAGRLGKLLGLGGKAGRVGRGARALGKASSALEDGERAAEEAARASEAARAAEDAAKAKSPDTAPPVPEGKAPPVEAPKPAEPPKPGEKTSPAEKEKPTEGERKTHEEKEPGTTDESTQPAPQTPKADYEQIRGLRAKVNVTREKLRGLEEAIESGEKRLGDLEASIEEAIEAGKKPLPANVKNAEALEKYLAKAREREAALKRELEAQQANIDRLGNAPGAEANWARLKHEDLGKAEICFPAGTLVKTPHGDRPIESLNPGDLVFAFDLADRRVIERPILHRIQSYATHVQAVQTPDGPIQATRTHRFWRENGADWVEVRHLWTGDLLLSIGLQTVPIAPGGAHAGGCATYNLVVDQAHNYFVGYAGILVHNGAESGLLSGERQVTSIYIIEAFNGNTGNYEIIYVGKTFQGEEGEAVKRFKQHLSNKPEWKNLKLKEPPEIIRKGNWTPFETAVNEEHFIRHYGGLKKDNPNSLLQNDIHAITDEKFDEIKKAVGDSMNPCVSL